MLQCYKSSSRRRRYCRWRFCIHSRIKEVAKVVDTLEGDEKTGAKVVLKALEAPLFQAAANAGLEGSVIINKVRESEVGTEFDFHYMKNM